MYRYDGQILLRYTENDGLAGNTVLNIQEDQTGNLYFDTTEGVSTFDGHQFSTLPVIEDDTFNWVLKPDDLWFSMGWEGNGVYRFDGRQLYHLHFPLTEQAKDFYVKYPDSSYSPYGMYRIYADSEGAIWFGTASLGLCRFDGKALRWLYEQQLTETPAGGDFGIRSIVEDDEGHFWFSNTRYRYSVRQNDENTDQVTYEREAGVSYLRENGESAFPYFLSMAKDEKGDIWMATYDDGVWQNTGAELLHYPLRKEEENIRLLTIYIDTDGQIWLGTQDAGVYRFSNGKFERFAWQK